jgi:hypothetical protein
VSNLLVSTGLAGAGYVYMNIDDCWMGRNRNNETGKLMAGSNFPNGMKHLGEMIHGKGLKYGESIAELLLLSHLFCASLYVWRTGLYSDRGFRTCQGFPGLIDNELLDIQTMAEWGIDFLKNDGCYATSPNLEASMHNDPSAFEVYKRASDAIHSTGRAIVHNVKGSGFGEGLGIEGARDVSNMRRCGGDIGDGFGSCVGEFFQCQQFQEYAGAGFWNDPVNRLPSLLLPFPPYLFRFLTPPAPLISF